MRYKILISIVLLNISAAYAIDNSVVPHSIHPPLTATNSLSSSGMPYRAANSVDRYQVCFNNSTWVVPPQTLLAYLYDNGNNTAVVDQTVWVITTYNKGYFFGKSYTAIDNSILSQRFLIGSVTTEGRVFMTFYSGSSTSTDLVTGLGILQVKSSGQCAFTMQTNSGQNGVSGLAHWSFMIPVKPGDAFYNHLPGTNMSVPQFLAQF